MFDGFYPASAYRRVATPKDIIPNKIFKTYEEARKYLAEYGHDSDDAVFVKLNKKWMRVIGYNEADELLARAESGLWRRAIPIQENQRSDKYETLD